MSLKKSVTYQSLVNIPWISRVRRNHGLEHATLHVLSKRFPGKGLAGHSDTKGFWLLGNVPTEEVESSVGEALERMKARGISKNEIRRRLGTSASQLARLLDTTNQTKSLDKMVELLAALDCEVEVTVRPAR